MLTNVEVDVADLAENDIEVTSYRGSGPGGQHRNTSDTAVRARHVPTGIVVTAERQRSWWQNRQDALVELERRVAATRAEVAAVAVNEERTGQIGSGTRGVANWTWCGWRNEVTCHRDGSTRRMDAALRGRLRLG